MCTLYGILPVKKGTVNSKFMYFIVVEWDVIWVSVIIYTAIFWSLYEAGVITLEKEVRLID